MSPEPLEGDAGLEPLLEFLKDHRGFDFTGYKRSSLARRITKRLEAVGCPDAASYLDYLEVHPDEFAQLFNTILINVTAFYRDAEAWDYVVEEVIPRLLAAVPPPQPIRIWSAGCASGEETYTMAMVLSEAMGEKDYFGRVKIYATDVDDEALEQARSAVYTAKQVEALPEHLRERCLERTDARFSVRKDLRRTVIFGRNDLVQDAPISRIDLLLCRNTLMYFNADTQAEILRHLHFALKPEGYLFMGKSEMLITHSELFSPVNLRRRVFTTAAGPRQVERQAALARWAGEGGGDALDPELRDLVLDAAPVAQVVLDADERVLLANEGARTMLKLDPADIGRPFRDLELSYRPVELRSHLRRVIDQREQVAIPPAEIPSAGGDGLVVQIDLVPLLDGDGNGGGVTGVSITFNDVTRLHRIQNELERSKHELETSYEELQSTVEELETTNEELQSTNEELETTNEELQSTNEELETMNEELQSTNEELETINDELRQRSLELNEVNAFMETIFTSLDLSVIVLDEGQRVRIWNERSTELWGLRESETRGEHLLALDFGLPVERLKPGLRACLDGSSERETVELDAINRRGKPQRCEVTIMPLHHGPEISGAILLIESRSGDDRG